MAAKRGTATTDHRARLVRILIVRTSVVLKFGAKVCAHRELCPCQAGAKIGRTTYPNAGFTMPDDAGVGNSP
jgi:hypothetical protein